MRFVATLLLGLAACFGNASELATVGDGNGDPPPFGSSPGACSSDDQCQLVGASCCECPSFATSIDDPRLAACDAVECETDALVCPTNVTAACNAQNQCELACAPLECIACEDGYVLEANGCLSCTCAIVPTQAPACSDDADCTRTRADCCGCDQGGDDTAVATADAASFDGALACPPAPQCPGQANGSEPTCNETEFTPRCARGECALLREPMPANACGRPDLPSCPTGTTCKINVNDSANLYGVGVCAP
jgi:hypothetical protein